MKYFFDSSILIDLTKKNEEATEQVKKLSDEENSELYINNLVYLEVLRGISCRHSKRYQESQEILESFGILQLNHKIYEDAICFSRFCKSKGLTLKGRCESIDFLHFMTAKYYNLKIISNDKGFERLEEKYPTYKKKIKIMTLKDKKL